MAPFLGFGCGSSSRPSPPMASSSAAPPRLDDKAAPMPVPFDESAPPAYGESSTPAAGHRVPLVASQSFPSIELVGPAPYQDLAGEPVWVASVILANEVTPGKACPHLPGVARWCWGGREMHDNAGTIRFDVLPLTSAMEWVPARDGKLPKGRRPVEGGYERDGKQLYHAIGTVSVADPSGPRTITIPGKTGEHLGSASFAYGGRELVMREGYSILVWRD